jgi:RNA polymerase sigma-B factor
MIGLPDGLSPPEDDDDSRNREREAERALFTRYKSDPSSAIEELLVTRFRNLVYRIVHRFRYTPDQFEDLVQVGSFGLLQAIRRFDPEMNIRFSTFAWPTVQGEIQRYFRDRTWAVNVPRDLKERSLKVFNAAQDITRAMGHDPTVLELSTATGLSEESVQEALELGSAYHPQSFSDYIRESDISFTIGDESGSMETRDMSLTQRSVFWEKLLGNLPQAEALVLRMYFFEDATQKEIADRLVTSQMNVSRLIRKAVGSIRKYIVPADVVDEAFR